MRRLLVVVYYAQPSNKSQCDQKLNLLVSSIKQRYPDEALILLGDLNRPRPAARDLLSPHNLFLAPAPQEPSQDPPQTFWYTRSQKYGQGHQYSEIDYIASNRQLDQLDSLKKNVPLKTDHLLILTSIDAKELNREAQPLRLKQKPQIKGGLLELDILKSLQSPSWPTIAFSKIAKQNDQTMVFRRQRSLLDEVLELEKKFEKGSQGREVAIAQILNIGKEKRVDQAAIKIEGEKHLKDDLKTQLKYQALQKQTMRLMPILLRSEEKTLCQRLMCSLRRFLPKTFFAVAKTSMRDLKRGQQALGFQMRVVDDVLIDQMSIKDYIQDLYTNTAGLNEDAEAIRGDQLSISEEELTRARGKLASGKAIGVDLLVDHWLNNDKIWTMIKDKLHDTFTQWLNGAKLPDYIKQGRVFCLSKETTAYPSLGKIRTITILPVLTKLYELVLQAKLQAETERLQFIPNNQLGFSQKSIGTQEHIFHIAKLISQSKEIQARYRATRTPVADRRKQWVLAIDFQSAFDKLDRNLLLKKMLAGGYEQQLVGAIQELLSNTTIVVDGEVIKTKRGCPQGSCLSPDLWAIGTADLCREINNIGTRESPEKSKALVFADDILCFAWDRSQLTIMWRLLKTWSRTNHIPINMEKCKLMELRVDQRTPRSLFSPLPELGL